ncbi:MAG: DUF1064 domain-containing protein [Eubacteriales bacterium]|nr:DUF1064 domain-containing protein [Eubacteriales bacterium]
MNKFNARKVTRGGQTFDSQTEYKRWLVLRDSERRGEIRDLRRQVKFELTPAYPAVGLRAMTYTADFVYTFGGKTVVEDVKGLTKGAAYELFKAKKKMLYFRYGYLVTEV